MKCYMKQIRARTLAVGVLAAISPVAGNVTAQELSMATLTVGGSFHAVGSGLAQVINQNTDLSISVSPFGTTGSWVPLLGRGQVHLGLASTEESAWAYRGAEHYPQAVPAIRLLTMGNRVQSAPM